MLLRREQRRIGATTLTPEGVVATAAVRRMRAILSAMAPKPPPPLVFAASFDFAVVGSGGWAPIAAAAGGGLFSMAAVLRIIRREVSTRIRRITVPSCEANRLVVGETEGKTARFGAKS